MVGDVAQKQLYASNTLQRALLWYNYSYHFDCSEKYWSRSRDEESLYSENTRDREATHILKNENESMLEQYRW